MGESGRYRLRRAAGLCWLLDMQQSGAKSAGVVSLNETGAFIWEQYMRLQSEEAVAEAVSACFSIPREESLEDVRQFLAQLKRQGLEL
ncbi:MAG: PqqD family protein [Agathobacter sp.]|nr:PqqD family protein [Agathobacter sp.]